MKKILFVLTSHDRKGNTGQPTGYYLPEAAHPWAVLHTNGFEVDFASPKGGTPPMEGADSIDPACRKFLENQNVSLKLKNTLTPDQVKPTDYSAILFVGGHGTMWDFPDNHSLASIAKSIYEDGGVVSALCHGPAALVNLKLSNGEYLIKGKQIAAFTDDEERAVNLDHVVPFMLESTLRQRGANHKHAPNWQANVVVDGRLVTGQNPASAEGIGLEISRLLKNSVIPLH
jgi:putative intracellular protease/amidase